MQSTGRAIRIPIVFLLVFLILHFFSSLTLASGVGLPTASTESGTWTRISLNYERLEPKIDSSNSAFRGESRDERMLLRAEYAPMPFVEVYLRLGVAAHETPSRNFNGSLGPAYGAGARWTFYRQNDLAFAMGGQILEYWSSDGGAAPSRLRWDELELYAGGVLEGYDRMVPYFGVLLSAARGDFKGGPTVHLDRLIDLFIGGEFKIYDRFAFLVEARVLGENGLTFSLAYDL